MARKRKADEPDGDGVPERGTAVADPPTVEQAAAQKNRPAASFAAHSDRTTRLEVAVWARPVKVGETEEYTQYSLTVSRSWPDTDGNWRQTAFYRAHDVPVLLSLVTQAYHWCVAKRTEVRVE